MTSDEWKTLNANDKVNGMNVLEVFYEALKNYTVIEFIPSNYEEIAHSFASCWAWLWNFASHTDKSPVGLPNTNLELTKEYVLVFKELIVGEPTTLTFCAKVLMEMISTNPKIATATLPDYSHTIIPWYKPMKGSVTWMPPTRATTMKALSL